MPWVAARECRLGPIAVLVQPPVPDVVAGDGCGTAGTTSTGQGACCTQCWLTEPSNTPARVPCPRLPTTSNCAPRPACRSAHRSARTELGEPSTPTTIGCPRPPGGRGDSCRLASCCVIANSPIQSPAPPRPAVQKPASAATHRVVAAWPCPHCPAV